MYTESGYSLYAKSGSRWALDVEIAFGLLSEELESRYGLLCLEGMREFASL